MQLRPANSADSSHIAHLTNLAGEGLPEYLWAADAPPGVSPLAFGASRAARAEGNFSYLNVVICEENGQVLGMLLSMAQPAPYELPNLNELPPQVKPLIELEALAPGSYYINAIGTYEHCRGRGIGTRLMGEAEKLSAAQGINTLSLIVASENRSAERLYLKLGYMPRERLPVIEYTGILHGGDWILMTKKL